MSRAFIKELDDVDSEALPELVISPHRNFVTAEGLELIEARLRELHTEFARVKETDDKSALARLERDMRYWSQRRASAEVIERPREVDSVRFGCRVVLRDASGAPRRFRIVGEDESDPGKGLISYVSPLAKFMLGRAVGDMVEFKGGEAEIIAIE